MVERPIQEHVTLHANVYNLADRYYYDQLHPAHVVLGPARNALIGLRFRF
jgi:catecholate siderophore receptor